MGLELVVVRAYFEHFRGPLLLLSHHYKPIREASNCTQKLQLTRRVLEGSQGVLAPLEVTHPKVRPGGSQITLASFRQSQFLQTLRVLYILRENSSLGDARAAFQYTYGCLPAAQD